MKIGGLKEVKHAVKVQNIGMKIWVTFFLLAWYG